MWSACYGLSVSYDIFAEPEYGSTEDCVTHSYTVKPRAYVDSMINEAEKINKKGTPTRFLCLMARIAYLGEPAYGDLDSKTGDKSGFDKVKENGEHFQAFLREKMSNGRRDYGGLACDLYRQVRNGLMHSNGKTVIRADDLISDIRHAIESIFKDNEIACRMIEFMRTHPLVVGILGEECKLQSPR